MIHVSTRDAARASMRTFATVSELKSTEIRTSVSMTHRTGTDSNCTSRMSATRVVLILEMRSVQPWTSAVVEDAAVDTLDRCSDSSSAMSPRPRGVDGRSELGRSRVSSSTFFVEKERTKSFDGDSCVVPCSSTHFAVTRSDAPPSSSMTWTMERAMDTAHKMPSAGNTNLGSFVAREKIVNSHSAATATSPSDSFSAMALTFWPSSHVADDALQPLGDVENAWGGSPGSSPGGGAALRTSSTKSTRPPKQPDATPRAPRAMAPTMFGRRRSSSLRSTRSERS